MVAFITKSKFFREDQKFGIKVRFDIGGAKFIDHIVWLHENLLENVNLLVDKLGANPMLPLDRPVFSTKEIEIEINNGVVSIL